MPYFLFIHLSFLLTCILGQCLITELSILWPAGHIWSFRHPCPARLRSIVNENINEKTLLEVVNLSSGLKNDLDGWRVATSSPCTEIRLTYFGFIRPPPRIATHICKTSSYISAQKASLGKPKDNFLFSAWLKSHLKPDGEEGLIVLMQPSTISVQSTNIWTLWFHGHTFVISLI